MAQSNLTPPEIHPGRSDQDEVFRLVNWLRRRAVSGFVTDVTAAAPISSSGGTTPNITHDASGVAANTYAYPSSVVVNATGHVTAIAAGVAPGPADAEYWVSIVNPSLPNAVDMGSLGAGVLQQTVTAGRAVPDSVFIPEHAVLFGGPTGLLDYDATTFYFDKANIRWGFGTPTPDASALVTFLRNQDASTNLFVTNDDPGVNASAGILLQASPSDPFASTPFSVLTTYGLNFIPPTGRPYFAATGTTLSVATNYGLTFDLSDMGAVDPSWYWVGRVPPSGDQALRMQLDYAGHLFLPSSLGAGGMVWADPGTTPTGELKLVTIDPSITFTGGVLSVTPGNYITALTGDVTATGPGSVAATISSHAVTAAKFRQSAAVSLVGNSTAGVADVQDITLGAGLSFSGTTLVSTGSGGTVTSVTATLPLTSTGGTTPVIALNYDNVTITLSGAAGTPIQRAALTGVITASAGSNATAFASAPAVSVLANATGAGASPGYFVAASSGDVLWRNGAGLSWSHIPVASVTGAQATITWPSSPQVLYSNGTSSDPIGDANITIDTATHQLRIIGTNGNQAFYNLLSGGDFERTIFYWTSNVFTVEQQAGGTGTVRGMQITSGLGLNADPDSISAGYLLTVAKTATRDRAWWSLAGNTISDGINREWFTIAPAATAITTAPIALAATVRVRSIDYTTSGANIVSLAAGIYVDQPTIDGLVQSISYSAYCIYAGGGTTSQSRFEGIVYSNAIVTGIGEFAGDGTNVFHLPPDGTGNTSGAIGRVPINIGGLTKYLRYYND